MNNQQFKVVFSTSKDLNDQSEIVEARTNAAAQKKFKDEKKKQYPDTVFFLKSATKIELEEKSDLAQKLTEILKDVPNVEKELGLQESTKVQEPIPAAKIEKNTIDYVAKHIRNFTDFSNWQAEHPNIIIRRKSDNERVCWTQEKPKKEGVMTFWIDGKARVIHFNTINEFYTATEETPEEVAKIAALNQYKWVSEKFKQGYFIVSKPYHQNLLDTLKNQL